MILDHAGVPYGPWVQVVDAAGHRRARGAEELGLAVITTQDVEVEEDASDGERQEVGAQQAAAVDGALPLAADAPRRGEIARRQAAQDLSEHVLRQEQDARRRRHHVPLLLLLFRHHQIKLLNPS